MHPLNIGKLALKKNNPLFYSCTPYGVLKLIESVLPKDCNGKVNLDGKKVTICGRSNIVGLPLSLLLNKRHATVSLCHSKTPKIEEYIREADIVVTAVGKGAGIFKGEWFKEGSIAIDVGINEIVTIDEVTKETKRSIAGDIEFEAAVQRCSYITPVPGGVGPMTIAMLMHNLVESWERANFDD